MASRARTHVQQTGNADTQAGNRYPYGLMRLGLICGAIKTIAVLNTLLPPILMARWQLRANFLKLRFSETKNEQFSEIIKRNF